MPALRNVISTNDQAKCAASLCSLKSQYARCVHYFVGEALSVLDEYWTAFANLLDPLLQQQCPMTDALRQAFIVADPVVSSVLDPLLLEHCSRIVREHSRNGCHQSEWKPVVRRAT